MWAEQEFAEIKRIGRVPKTLSAINWFQTGPSSEGLLHAAVIVACDAIGMYSRKRTISLILIIRFLSFPF